MLRRSFILFGLFAVSAVLIARASTSEIPLVRESFDRFPMQIADWSGRQDRPLDAEEIAVLGATDYLARTYIGPRSVAGLFVGYWASQRQGDSVHSPLNCMPGAGWQPLSKTTLRIELSPTGGSQPQTIGVNRYVVQKGLDRKMVLYWYQSHGRVVASEYMSKIFLVTDAARLHRTDAALVRVITTIDTAHDESSAEREAVRFVQSFFTVLDSYLPS